jgi:hypothetical protein
VVLRAVPIGSESANEVSMFKLSWCYAYKVRKADAPAWSGIIHQKHAHFGFTGLMMDPGGGGNWIRPELAKVSQKIRGIDTIVRPIACLEDEQTMMMNAEFILSMFILKDLRVAQVFGNMNLAGPENLNDMAHTELVEAIANIGFPIPVARTLDETSPFLPGQFASDEERHASTLVELIGTQLMGVFFQLNDDGTTFYTRRNARVFGSKKRKDFAYAAMMAYFRFLLWMRSGSQEIHLSDQEAAMAGG